MAGSYETNGSIVTIHFDYTIGSPTALNVINNAASLLYGRNFPYDFTTSSLSALTNNQKLGIVDSYVKRTVVDLSRQNARDERVRTAREDAIDAGSSLDL